MAVIINAEAESNAGLVREHNEDCFGVEHEAKVYLVADGVGGHARGEVASAIVRETVLQRYIESQDLVNAIGDAHQAVKQTATELENARGMSATVVAIAFDNCTYKIAWVGDSRLYLYKPNKQQLEQISSDHSLVQILFDKGVISREEMHSHPEKNIITQAVGLESVENLDIGSGTGRCENNDIFLLCSDGLTDMLKDEALCEILSRDINLQEKVRYLIGAALKAGGKDNVTVLLLETSEINDSAEASAANVTKEEVLSAQSGANKSRSTALLCGLIMIALVVGTLLYFQK